MKNRCLVMDIETRTFDDQVDASKDELRYVGFRLPTGKKFVFHYSEREAIQNMLDMYPVIVGHNIREREYKGMSMGYDIKVMERHGFKFFHNGKRHIFVDTQQIMEKRAKSMMNIDLEQGQFNLRALAEMFNLPVKKGHFDFHLLQKPALVGEELKLLKEYLEADLDTTYELFNYLYEFFEGLTEFMKIEDVQNMSWLTSSSGTTAYKSICHMAGLPEIYDDNVTMKNKAYEGAFVALPEIDSAMGDIYCFDFNSLYPHMFMGGNLYSRVKEGEIGYTGVGVYTALNDGDDIKGEYSTVQGKIENTIYNLFVSRKTVKEQMKSLEKGTIEYKTLDKKQLAMKIVLNTCFSDDTEILTLDGIKSIKDVKIGDMVYSINKETGITELKKVIDTQSFKYSGEMNHFKSSRYDVLVTPDHNMFLEKIHKDKSFTKPLTVKAMNVSGGGYRFPKHMPTIQPEETIDSHRFYLYGIYLSEGHIRNTFRKGKSNGFSINLSQYIKINPEIYDRIERALIACGIKYSNNEKGFNIYSQDYYNELNALFGRLDKKHIDKKLLETSSTIQLYNLFRGMYDGDGTKKQNIYTTKHICLRDDFIQLITRLGYKWIYRFDSGVHRINFRDGNKQSWLKSRNIYKQQYSGMVYCVTVEDNHTVLIGRNGKFEWCGQCYGISGSPRFSSVYDLITASDCTAMARRSIKYARSQLEKNGYKCLYTDTDSVYVLDTFKDKVRLMALADKITKDQIDSFNIKVETHKFDLECAIKQVWFFRDDTGKFLKKHYMYRKDNDELIVKGISIVKGNCSQIAKDVFSNHIKPHLFEAGEDFYITPSTILSWVKDTSERNSTLLVRRYRVNPITSYKTTTSIQAQISFRYGAGEHYLIENRFIGVGKGKKYAKIDELQKAFGTKWIDAVELGSHYEDLTVFIRPNERNLKIKKIKENKTLDLY